MLPVVVGERATHLQMLCYALSLIPVSILLTLTNPMLGAFSMFVMVALGAVFSFKVWQLLRLGSEAKPIRDKKAWDVFGFSLIYLGLYFLCLIVDSTLV